MIKDNEGTNLLPKDWEMWTTGRRWQAIHKKAKGGDKHLYTRIHKSRDNAIRAAEQIIAIGVQEG